jgi:GntR family transcriptional regulator/MocR family aminotransferase
MRAAKIHLEGQLAVDRAGDEPLWLQIVGQLERAIQRGNLDRGATLPSSRTLARALGVSRNTVLCAYDELKSRGLIAGHRGAGMRIAAVGGMTGFDLRRLLREAQFPARWITVEDPDGNALRVAWHR